MKKSYALRSIAVVAMMIAAVGAMPKSNLGSTGHYTFNNVELKPGKTVFQDLSYVEPAVSQTNAPKKVEGDVTLTIKLEYDAEVFNAPWMANLIDDNGVESVYLPWGSDVADFPVQPGTYDIALYFSTKTSMPYFVIKEQVNVTEDITVTFNPNEAVNEINFKHCRKDGSDFVHGLIEYDENWNSHELESGNTDITLIYDYVILKGVGIANSILMITPGGVTDESARVPKLEYHINNVSDRYTFVQMQVSQSEGIWYVSQHSTNNPQVGTIEADASLYNSSLETYQYSPYGKSQNGFGFSLPLYVIYDNKLVDGGAMGYLDPAAKEDEQVTIETCVNLPYQDPYDENIHYLAGSIFNDFCIEIQESWGTNTQYYKTVSKPYTFIDGVKTYVAVPAINQNNEVIATAAVIAPNGKTTYQVLPGCEAFTTTAENVQQVCGASVPINALLVQNGGNLYGEYGTEGLRPNYIGRLGENRTGDAKLNEITATFNGETIEDITAWEGLDDGVYEVTYTNTNCEVDGLQGKNVTTISYDQSQDDATPPTITMLQFKNQDGIVTDRFEKAEDGTMVFTAADFNQPEVSAWNEPFNHDLPAEIKVEYAPYDSEEWVELPFESTPLRESVLGWGYVYSLPLSEVDVHTDNGWYDLRFTFADETGNWQKQVVSPAFFINELIDNTGISHVDATNVTDETIFDLQGRKVRSLNGLTPGIYIQGGKKIIVK